RGPPVRGARGGRHPGEGERRGAAPRLRDPVDGGVPRRGRRSADAAAPERARRVTAAAAGGDRRPAARALDTRGEGRSAVFGGARRPPGRGVRPRRAGDPPPAAPGVRAIPPLPRLRLRLPVLAVQRVTYGARPGTPSRVSLLRR